MPGAIHKGAVASLHVHHTAVEQVLTHTRVRRTAAHRLQVPVHRRPPSRRGRHVVEVALLTHLAAVLARDIHQDRVRLQRRHATGGALPVDQLEEAPLLRCHSLRAGRSLSRGRRAGGRALLTRLPHRLAGLSLDRPNVGREGDCRDQQADTIEPTTDSYHMECSPPTGGQSNNQTESELRYGELSVEGMVPCRGGGRFADNSEGRRPAR